MAQNYEEKKQARIERFRGRADKARKESDRRYNAAKTTADMIPLGQPILVGHHSERGHRAMIKRIDTNMRKSIEADKKAEYYERRADVVQSNRAISSDDPQAVQKLKEKLAGLEKNHQLMKDANKIIKSQKLDEAQKIEQLKGLGFSDALAVETMKPDFCGRVGFPGFALANNSAEIKRVQDRIKRLEKLENATTTESVINGVRIVDNVEENRLQMFFDGVPAQETRDKLKRRGFRWSRYNGCWQRHRSNAATYYAKQIAGEKV